MVPPLGLSNKPLSLNSTIFSPIGDEKGSNIEAPKSESTPVQNFEDEGGSGGDMFDFAPAKPKVLSSPPLEEHLFQSSLWPEINKLYAHGDNISSVSSSKTLPFFASSCQGFFFFF